MTVEALVDTAVVALLDALDAVRTTPAPLGMEAARLAALAHASAELRGVFLRDLGAVDAAAHGARGPADLLADTAGVPVWQARRDAGLARRLAVVPGLAQQVAGGGLALEAALLLVRAWQALPSRLQDEELARALVTLGQLVDLRDLRTKVDELLGALAPDVTDADLADAREGASLRVVDVGARTRIEGECDRLTGEPVRQVLHSSAEAARGAEGDDRDGPRRLLDALVACLTAASTTEAVPGDARLVVVTDVDDLARTTDVQPDRVAPDDAVAGLFAGTDLLPAPSRAGRTALRRRLAPPGPRAAAAASPSARAPSPHWPARAS